MMAGNPSWWSMHKNLRSSSISGASDHDHHEAAVVAPNLLISQTQAQTQTQTQTQTHPSNSMLNLHEYLSSSSKSSSSSPSSSSSFLPLTSLAHHEQYAQHFPHSWSQLLLGVLAGEEEERYGANNVFQSTRALISNGVADVKQEVSSHINNSNNNNNNSYLCNHGKQDGVTNGLSIPPPATANWSQNMPISSPRSCVTSLSSNSNMLDFSTTNKRSLQVEATRQHADHSNSECNSTAAGGVPKKPRLQSSSTPPLKVRKEKLGDRITALHQLVSPFGKTDTASVLMEAIGYIRFLQAQIQALSSPYLGDNNASIRKNQHFENKEAAKDLRSKGLCLVPTSCTHLVAIATDNIGADYWAQIQSLGGGF